MRETAQCPPSTLYPPTTGLILHLPSSDLRMRRAYLCPLWSNKSPLRKHASTFRSANDNRGYNFHQLTSNAMKYKIPLALMSEGRHL